MKVAFKSVITTYNPEHRTIINNCIVAFVSNNEIETRNYFSNKFMKDLFL